MRVKEVWEPSLVRVLRRCRTGSGALQGSSLS